LRGQRGPGCERRHRNRDGSGRRRSGGIEIDVQLGELGGELTRELGSGLRESGSRRGRRAASRGISEAALGAKDVALVGAGLDLAENSLPVRLIRVVALQDHLEPEPHRRVPEVLLPEHVNLPVDVLSGNRGLHLLEAHEVLLVERAQPVYGRLELADQHLDLGLLHGAARFFKEGRARARRERYRSRP
jgi:hypothetical protein